MAVVIVVVLDCSVPYWLMRWRKGRSQPSASPRQHFNRVRSSIDATTTDGKSNPIRFPSLLLSGLDHRRDHLLPCPLFLSQYSKEADSENFYEILTHLINST
eukprot:scaffold4983_cov71-Cylindrotheca_fusiformis.AAC.1